MRLLVEGKLEFPLSKLAAGDPQLREFLLDRIKFYFREVRGFAYDEVNAVLASGSENLPDIEPRLTALRLSVRPRISSRWRPASSAFRTSSARHRLKARARPMRPCSKLGRSGNSMTNSGGCAMRPARIRIPAGARSHRFTAAGGGPVLR